MLPGLWVMLLVVPPLLWLAFGTIDWATFAGSPVTWRFMLRNAALLGKAYHLPGLFVTHPLPGLVNGSLWTIPHEVRCYLVLAALAAVGLTQPRWLCTLVIGVGLLVHLLLPGTTVEWFDGSRWLAFSFCIGVLAWLWRDSLPLSWPLAVACVGIALALSPGTLGKGTMLQTAFAYLALLIAFRIPEGWKAMSARMPGYSYGIYIYAFPAQQAALAMGATTPLANLGLAFAITLPLAALSWHLSRKAGAALQDRQDLAGEGNAAALIASLWRSNFPELCGERTWHAPCIASVEQRETVMIRSSTAAAAATFIFVTLLAGPPTEIVVTLLVGMALVGVRAAGIGRSVGQRKHSDA